ncbi:hypothetical protein A2625_04020 [candidate division WOR-1 bacterium RIFCSPHIGHO2_01_FULL_53_15]|uniref:Uncharacterized protein n=1 Tax=candidate division WOR-1 bacterium RIFCSPHIGHO2_01_FULL_53_15 TaxID=1802564 RepID=A0A1F4Q038_UNCSA|nr:MAG: hypothetical protein A2625_04020 [candidate division WOR-1 bacterium RIFCSPHIGHO2_01_FULL_53_15]OGC12937.1 MAG: hypothetical protein A3D23_05055 [candidate division WOR-1 bacterium RIFCSPHIGHO2_02_FULL_53_26]
MNNDDTNSHEYHVNNEFEEWALSYSGMVGNPGGKYWFSGVEYGRKVDEKTKDNRHKGLVDQIRSENERFSRDQVPMEWDDNFKLKYNDERNGKYTSWRTCQKMAKVIAQIENSNNWKEYWQEYISKKLFTAKCQNGDTFQVNLYPLDFPKTTTTFSEAEKTVTGMKDKEEYYKWCKSNRFGRLKEMFDKNREHIDFVLCFGRLHTKEYISVFAEGKENECQEIRINKHNGKGCTMLSFAALRPRIFVVPHFACRWWSDKDLQWLGDKIKK